MLKHIPWPEEIGPPITWDNCKNYKFTMVPQPNEVFNIAIHYMRFKENVKRFTSTWNKYQTISLQFPEVEDRHLWIYYDTLEEIAQELETYNQRKPEPALDIREDEKRLEIRKEMVELKRKEKSSDFIFALAGLGIFLAYSLLKKDSA